MNELKTTTLTNRIKAAIRAFQGKPFQTLQLGVEVKKCSECEHKSPFNWPDFHDFDIGTDHNGKYFLSLHNGYNADAEEAGSALGIFTEDQVRTLISNLRYFLGEEDD